MFLLNLSNEEWCFISGIIRFSDDILDRHYSDNKLSWVDVWHHPHQEWFIEKHIDDLTKEYWIYIYACILFYLKNL